MSVKKEFRVIIPEENYQIIEFRQENLPGIGVINLSLVDFEPKEVFSWHCSIMINFENFIENGMPTNDDVLRAEKFEDFLNENIKGVDKEKPNALFLARITWNETRELIWRVYDAKLTNDFLEKIIEENNYPFEFNYRIDDDEDWELAKWHLGSVK
ncbi:hypothetical protein FCR2A7T_06940 [Flavobacterium cauense R2A-7]|uniref:DUF695 domain-containing protein n=1 Tax=Flavobacterium cauense TaxID=510946 RepID=UPI0003C60477|nr:DUF695 domain-containing protein [Flavobacterium cauense]ESU21266.1 hypothetical protein FCR2A7T_06940 [Flavobacterium cauense R2A-7]KGO79014.1 hypothetical protein Q762_14690 [Flavobacterium cauense R2A-7]